MTSTATTSTHSDADIMLVAEGLVRVVGTDGAADQLRRLYGERRVAQVLLSAGPRRPATTVLPHPVAPRSSAGTSAYARAAARPAAAGRTIWL